MKTKQNKTFHFLLTLFALGMTIAFGFFFKEVAEMNGFVFASIMQGILVIATVLSGIHDYINWKR